MASSDHIDASWQGLYRTAAIAALLAAAVFRRNWSAEVSLLRTLGLMRVGPATTPVSAADWYGVLQAHPILGLILLNFVDVINYALVGLVLLALYVALWRISQSAMTIAIACGFVGIVLCFASNRAFGLLALSNRHALTAVPAEKATLLAAGDALLALDNPGMGQMSYGVASSFFLVTASSLIASFVMLRSTSFSRATAWVGIVAHLTLLGRFVTTLLPPAYSAIPPSLAAPLLIAWNIMVARRLFRLAQAT